MKIPSLFAAVVLSCLLPVAASAHERCFELMGRGGYGGGHGRLCIIEREQGRQATAVLSENNVIVAQLELSLKSRARCIDCNVDVFAPVAPSLFDKIFEIRFDGTRSPALETGKVRIGDRKYFYRWTGQPPVQPPPPPVAPMPVEPPPPPEGMAPDNFEQLLRALDKNQWSVSGIEGVISSAAQTNRFTCQQVAAILKKVPGQALKESAAKQLVPRIVDYENIAVVSAELRGDALKYRR